MSGCVRSIHTKNYQNLIISFQVTAKNVGDVFLGQSVQWSDVGSAAGRLSLSVATLRRRYSYRARKNL